MASKRLQAACLLTSLQAITRFVGSNEEIGRNDVPNPSQHIHHCDRHGPFLRRSSHGVGGPCTDKRIREVHAANLDEGCSIPRIPIFGSKADDVADVSESGGASEMVTTLLCLVGVRGVYQ